MSCTLVLLVLPATTLAAQQSGRELQADAAASRIYVVTHRAGLLSFLGHDHAILAPRWTARLCWDAPEHAASRAELVVDAQLLEIDADSVRRLAGLGKGPSPRQRAEIQRKLHTENNLDSERHPQLRFESRSLRAVADTLFVRGDLTIRDQTRAVEMPILMQHRPDGSYWLAGSLSIRPSEFGIRPESIGGVVKVADVLDLHVGLLVRSTPSGC